MKYLKKITSMLVKHEQQVNFIHSIVGGYWVKPFFVNVYVVFNVKLSVITNKDNSLSNFFLIIPLT